MACQCEKLQKQLKRYETKFSDLVGSYKTLVEEKKVLEATLKTLSSNSSPTHSGDKGTVLDAGDGLGAAIPRNKPDSHQSSSGGDVEDENLSSTTDEEISIGISHVKLLEEKVSMLSKALNSVTEGKAKMEAAFQNDRKSIITEYSLAAEKIETKMEVALKKEHEMRAKLCQEQQEREEESKSHSIMLKELQEILALERDEKNVLKLKAQLKEPFDRVTSETKICELQERDISKIAEKDEQQRQASRIEELLDNQQLQLEEKRIVELESKLSELSDAVGNYDRKRLEDQLVIRKLRDRLENLEIENSALSSPTDSAIILSNKSEKLIGQHILYGEIENSPLIDSTHQACQEEYKQLLEEFDLYKRKNKYRISKDTTPDEIAEYKKRICRLEKEIDRLKMYADGKERTNLKIISGLQIEVTRSKEEFEEKAENINKEHKLGIEQMECELRKQRIRTMEVISDRDMEIERLQNQSCEYGESPNITHSISYRDYGKLPDTHTAPVQSDDTSMINEIVKSPLHVGPDGIGQFHFMQQIAHYDAELYSCRMQLLDFESQVRDFEKREEQLLIQMQALKEEIRGLERNKSRESANLEYLKNVCLQYMLTDSVGVKTQMSIAISTVLMFSPAEIAQIQKRQKSGWW